MSFNARLDEDARLCILKTLSEQPDERLSDRMLVPYLDSWGIRRSIDYVRTQLLHMQTLGVVALPEQTPAIMVAEITRAGRHHLERRSRVAGIRFPEQGEFPERG